MQAFEPKPTGEPAGGVLYLVATPIGNLSDLSQRALRVLEGASVIAAEDTRVPGKLLDRFGLHTPLVAYHQHNCRSQGPVLLERLQAGESVALVTDAGTPAISDPGAELVQLCAEAGVTCVAVPGACAAITALCVSALPTRRFCFEGFLEAQGSGRKKQLAELAKEPRTLVLYEAPHRLCRTLEDLARAFGPDRRLALCRELTKLNEEVLRLTLSQAVEHYRSHTPRGEYVLVIAGAPPQDAAAQWETLSPQEHFQLYLSQGMTKMEALKAVAKDRDLPKSQLYDQLMK